MRFLKYLFFTITESRETLQNGDLYTTFKSVDAMSIYQAAVKNNGKNLIAGNFAVYSDVLRPGFAHVWN